MGIKEYFNSQSWRFAVTYADRAPHEYIVRGKCNGTEDEFERAVRFIRANGFTAHFWGRPQTYIYLDGHFYWTMGAPPEETTVINRSNANDYHVSIKLREDFSKCQ